MRKSSLWVFFLSVLLMTGSACTLATVRSSEEDLDAKQGFNAERYVDEIRDSNLLPTMNDVILHAEKITKVYPGTVALNEVDFNIYRGKVNVLVGENGVGNDTVALRQR